MERRAPASFIATAWIPRAARSGCAALALLAFLAGCGGIVPRPKAPDTAFDMGLAPPAATPARIHQSLLVPDVDAPSWLETPGIFYRLSFENEARPRAYTQSRWVAPPPALFSERLRARLAGASDAGVISSGEGGRADYLLRVEMEEFSQVFDSLESSRGIVRLRATLVREPRRQLVAQKGFAVSRPASSANAEGAAKALTEASDAVIGEIVDWVDGILKGDGEVRARAELEAGRPPRR